MKGITMQQFDEWLKQIDSVRSFKMYIHNTSRAVGNQLVAGEAIEIRSGRNCMSSTVVNGGRMDQGYLEKFRLYQHLDGQANVILIMPDEIAIEHYCGSPKGNDGANKGHFNHIQLDNTVAGFNYAVQQQNNKRLSLEVSHVNNALVLGYYDRQHDMFVLNENCLLLKEEEVYRQLVEKATTHANEFYDRDLKMVIAQDAQQRDKINEVNALLDGQGFRNLKMDAYMKYSFSQEYMYDQDCDNTKLLVPSTNNSAFVSNILQAYKEHMDTISKEYSFND